jgi:ATP-binding cassette subfamily F protein uup
MADYTVVNDGDMQHLHAEAENIIHMLNEWFGREGNNTMAEEKKTAGQQLEEQLLAYTGTLLLVSHDREFLDNVVTSTFVLEGDGTVSPYPGGYADYLAQSAARRETEKREAAAEARRESEETRAAARLTPARKLSYNEQRELDALPERIAALETELADIRAALADGSLFRTDAARAQRLTGRLQPAEAELDAAVERWAELEERRG